MGAASIVLGFIGFHRLFDQRDEPHSYWTTAYYVLGLFAVDGAREAEPIPWTLQVARFLAPLTIATAALGAFAKVFRQESLRLWGSVAYRRPVVVVGTTPLARRIVRDSIAQQRECIVVLVNTSQESEVSGDLPVPIVTLNRPADGLPSREDVADALRRAHLHRAHMAVVSTGSDALNVFIGDAAASSLSVALPVSGESVASRAARFVEGAQPMVAVEIGSPMVLGALQRVVPPRSRSPIEYFSSTERIARALIESLDVSDALSLRPTRHHVPHLIVHGGSPLCIASAVQAVRNWKVDLVRESRKDSTGADPGATERPHITVIVPGATEQDRHEVLCDLERGHPDIRPDSGAVVVQVVSSLKDVASTSEIPPPSAFVVDAVGGAVDIESVMTTVVSPMALSVPVVIAIDQAEATWRQAIGAHATLVDVSSLAWSLEWLQLGLMEDVARAVQAADLRDWDRTSEDRANRTWSQLDSEMRSKNRAAVDGVREALERCGYVLVRQTDPRAEEWTVPEEHVDVLAEHIHEWWRAVEAHHRRLDRRTTHAHDIPWAELRARIDGEREAALAVGESPRDDWNRSKARSVAADLATVGLQVQPRVALGLQPGPPFTARLIEEVATAYRGLLPVEARTHRSPRTGSALMIEREADRASARAVAEHLVTLGLRAVPASSASTVAVLDPTRVETASRNEHDRWCEFTRRCGYVWGPTRDDDADPPAHPHLVPWAELDEPTREKDRERIRAIPGLLSEVGLALVPGEDRS